MTLGTFVIMLIVGAAGVVLGAYFGRAGRAPKKEGLIVNPAQVEEKERNLARVLQAAQEKGEITNNDVEHMLGVSDATAERYLDELEQDGKLTQVGRTGKWVSYRAR